MRKIENKIIWFLLVGLSAVAMTGCGKSETYKETYAQSEVKSISISTVVTNVEVESVEGDDIKISYTGKEKMTNSLEGGELKIKIVDQIGVLHLESNTLYIELPKDYDKEVSVVSNAGTLETVDISANIEAETKAGEMESNVCPAKIKQSNQGIGYTFSGTIGNDNAATTVQLSTCDGDVILN